MKRILLERILEPFHHVKVARRREGPPPPNEYPHIVFPIPTPSVRGGHPPAEKVWSPYLAVNSKGISGHPPVEKV